MKRAFGYALLLASLSVPAFAAKNSESVTINSAVKVGTTELPAGDYKVSWTGAGSAVQVTFAQKGKAPVTVPAKAVEEKNRHVATITNEVGGAHVLQSLQLDHVTLTMTDNSASGQ